MLVLDSLERILKGVDADEALFSGLRPVSEVEQEWTWTSPRQPEFRADFKAFTSHLAEHFGHTAPPLCCLAVVMVMPRMFFEKFSDIPEPTLGFIEYKLPTYAEAFGIKLNHKKRFKVWWDDIEPYSWKSTIRAVPIDIKPIVIAMGVCLPGGARVFHPYSAILPTHAGQWIRLVARSIRRDLRTAIRKRLNAG